MAGRQGRPLVQKKKNNNNNKIVELNSVFVDFLILLFFFFTKKKKIENLKPTLFVGGSEICGHVICGCSVIIVFRMLVLV